MKWTAMLGVATVGVWMLAGAAATAADKAEDGTGRRPVCHVCGMYIDEFKDTATELGYDKGANEQFCGMACTLRRVNEEGGMGAVKSANVTDWQTHKAIPLDKAVLVVGSDEVPDMIPNILAFGSESDAVAFQKQHGGTVVSLDRMLAAISYQGMTMPFRVTPAPTPPQGIFSVGIVASQMVKDNLMRGNDDISRDEALASRPMVPKKMDGRMIGLGVGYAVNDDVYLDAMVPYCWKEMTSEKKDGHEMRFREHGMGDVTLSGRWRCCHDEMSDRHLAFVVRAGLPSGEFKEANRSRPGLQLGTESFAAGAGILFSQHLGLFWVNCGVEYRYNFENSTDYKFGDVAQAGVAVHFTPCTRTMLGVEVDGSKVLKNQDNEVDVPNTGCTGVFGSLVAQQRLALICGGNVDLRAMFGVPLYEDVEGIQLGEAYHLAVGVQWKTKF